MKLEKRGGRVRITAAAASLSSLESVVRFWMSQTPPPVSIRGADKITDRPSDLLNLLMRRTVKECCSTAGYCKQII